MEPLLHSLAKEAKKASTTLRLHSSEKKNHTLKLIAEELNQNSNAILNANAQDIESANLSSTLLDRLTLSPSRLDAIIADVYHVAQLSDPVGDIMSSTCLESGLKLSKKRVPIGVIGVIYEARPNVTVDIASLCLKTGNCAILRGGKETLRTNQALMQAIQSALQKAELPKATLQLIENPDRDQIAELVTLDAYIDMIIPRGGEKLHRFCLEHSTIPVITGGIGICHLFVDASANLEKSIEVIANAKTQRPSVCNALDTLLVHDAIAKDLLPKLVQHLEEKNVELRLDPIANSLLKHKQCKQASEEDWKKEWLDLILGIKVVHSLEEAIQHIQSYSSNHSDGILTESIENARHFVESIDSAAVYVNASTRFTDGGQFGLGAEVAVSTQKLHARGPMGLEELTTYKWIVEGKYHIRQG